MDSPPPSRESGDTAPLPLANNSTGLINDLMSGKPILSQLSAAVASGDAQAVEDVQSKNSYNLSLESVDKVLQGADPGPKFDIRLVAGLYTFQAPADLTSKQMRVDPLSSRLFIDELWVNNSTDAQGHVVFDHLGFSYSLVFSVTYNASGVPNPFNVSGTRLPTGPPDPSSPPQKVSAKQSVPEPPQPPPEDWTTKPGWLDTAAIITIFGGGIPLLFSIIKKVKEKLQKKGEQDKLAKDYDSMVEKFKLVQKRVEQAAADVVLLSPEENSFRLADHEDDIQDAIETQINTDIEKAGVNGIDEDKLRANAAEAVSNKVRDVYLEQNEAAILRKLQPFNNIMEREGKAEAVKKVLDARLGGNLIYSNPQALHWLGDMVDKNVARAEVEKARENANAAGTARSNAEQEVAEARAEKDRVRAEKEAYEKEHAGDVEKPLDYEKRIEELTDQAAELEKGERAAQAEAAKHAAEVEDQRAKLEKSQQDEERAAKASAEHSAEAFGRRE